MAYIVSKRMHDAVAEIGVDAAGKAHVLNANTQVSLLTGYNEDTLKTMEAFDLFSPESAQNLRDERDFDPDIGFDELFRRFPRQTLRAALGRDVPVEMKIFALPPSKGFVANYEIIFRDKTLVHQLADRMRDNVASAPQEARDRATEFYTGAVAEDALATICRYATERVETPVSLALIYAGFSKNSLLSGVRPGDRENLMAAVGSEMRNFIRAEDVAFYLKKDSLKNCGAELAAKQCPEGVFCVALINCDVVQAHRCLERMRRGVTESEAIKNMCYPLSGELHLSIGCASAAFDAESGFSASHMLEGAGEALCAAIHMGGERVAIASNGEVLLRYAASAGSPDKQAPAPQKSSKGFFRRFGGR